MSDNWTAILVYLAVVGALVGAGALAAFIFRRGPVFAFGVSSGLLVSLFTALYFIVNEPNWAGDVIAIMGIGG